MARLNGRLFLNVNNLWMYYLAHLNEFQIKFEYVINRATMLSGNITTMEKFVVRLSNRSSLIWFYLLILITNSLLTWLRNLVPTESQLSAHGWSLIIFSYSFSSFSIFSWKNSQENHQCVGAIIIIIRHNKYRIKFCFYWK